MKKRFFLFGDAFILTCYIKREHSTLAIHFLPPDYVSITKCQCTFLTTNTCFLSWKNNFTMTITHEILLSNTQNLIIKTASGQRPQKHVKESQK